MIERHAVARIGWLRAAVLGANDGIVSTASLIVGVAAAARGESDVLIAGLAGLVAGAMSMAAGEYVSVSSQSDTEAADIAREMGELAQFPEAELAELSAIYRQRGLPEGLAHQVAVALTQHDALATHARDELGLADLHRARPIQAAFTSAGTFALGAALPLAALLPVRPRPQRSALRRANPPDRTGLHLKARRRHFVLMRAHLLLQRNKGRTASPPTLART